MEQPLTLKPVKPTPGPSVRAPSGSDLAPWSYDYIPAQKPPANLLIFLHGMGDTKASFANLARSMKWPETATISLQAPLPVPLMPDSWMWYNAFDQQFNQLQNPDSRSVVPFLRKLLGQLLGLGWTLDRVHLLGWQQGATAAMELALSLATEPVDGGKRLGSVASVCGKLEREPSVTGAETPLLWFTRSEERSAAAKTQEDWAKKAFKSVVIRRGEPGSLNMPGAKEWPWFFQFWGQVFAKADDGWKGDGEVYEVVQSYAAVVQ